MMPLNVPQRSSKEEYRPAEMNVTVAWAPGKPEDKHTQAQAQAHAESEKAKEKESAQTHDDTESNADANSNSDSEEKDEKDEKSTVEGDDVTVSGWAGVCLLLVRVRACDYGV